MLSLGCGDQHLVQWVVEHLSDLVLVGAKEVHRLAREGVPETDGTILHTYEDLHSVGGPRQSSRVLFSLEAGDLFGVFLTSRLVKVKYSNQPVLKSRTKEVVLLEIQRQCFNRSFLWGVDTDQ